MSARLALAPPPPLAAKRSRLLRIRYWNLVSEACYHLQYHVIGTLTRLIAWPRWRRAAWLAGFELPFGVRRSGIAEYWLEPLAEHDAGNDAGNAAADPWFVAHWAAIDLGSPRPRRRTRCRAALRQRMPVTRSDLAAAEARMAATERAWIAALEDFSGMPRRPAAKRLPRLGLVTEDALHAQDDQ